MPVYTVRCPTGHRTEQYLTLQEYQFLVVNRRLRCNCGAIGEIVITAPLLVKVAADVSYDSPIDGKIISSWAAREEDLKRHNCTPYDPDCKQDYATRIKDSEAALDRTIDEHVERTIAQMPTAKRGELYSELTEQGVEADVIRR